MAKILVVDDEPDAVELVEFNLKQAASRSSRQPTAWTRH
jgi:CheY-like chemotaxis protein